MFGTAKSVQVMNVDLRPRKNKELLWHSTVLDGKIIYFGSDRQAKKFGDERGFVVQFDLKVIDSPLLVSNEEESW